MGGFAIPFGGGLDVQGIVDRLIFVQSEPIRLLEKQEGTLRQRIDAYRSLQSKLSELAARVGGLNSLDSFAAKLAVSSRPEVLTAKADSQSASGSFSVQVNRTARFDNFASDAVFSSSDAAIGTGTFRLTGGGESELIAVDSSNNTLGGLRDAINKLDVPVRASIVNDGSGFRLVLTAEQSGAAGALSISENTLTEIDGSPLGFARTHQVGSTAELDAEIVVNGLTVTSSDNSVEGVIEGVTLQLQGTGSATLTLSNDAGKAVGAVEAFVEAYNDLAAFINSQFFFDPSSRGAGALATQSLLRRIQSELSTVVRTGIGAEGSFTTLRSAGIDLQADGTLTIDGARLAAVGENAFADLGRLFLASGVVSNPENLAYLDAGRAAAGRYEVYVDTVAEPALIFAPNPIRGALGIDETLTFTLDGTTSTVRLSADQDIDSIVAALNAAFAADGLALTAINSRDRLELRSNSLGTDVALTVVSDVNSGQGTGIGTSGLSDIGRDVEASLRNVLTGETFRANGIGDILTGSDDRVKGLRLRVTASATGLAGHLDLTVGFAERFDRVLNGLTDLDSPIADVLKRLEGQVRGIEDDIAAFEDRLELRRQRLIAEFSRADQALRQLAQLQATLGGIESGLGGFL